MSGRMDDFFGQVIAGLIVAALVAVSTWMAQRLREGGTLLHSAPVSVHVWVEPVLSRRSWRLAPVLTAGLRVDALHREKPPKRRDYKMAMWDASPSWDTDADRLKRRTELLREPLYPLSIDVTGGDSLCVVRVVLVNTSSSTLVQEEVGPLYLLIGRPELSILGWRYDRFDEAGLERAVADPLSSTLGPGLGAGRL